MIPDPFFFTLLIAMCLLLEGFFSGAEVALVSVDKSRIRRKAEGGSAAARRVQALMEHPERMLSATLIGTTLAVVAASFLANEMFAAQFGPQRSGWAMAMMIPLILLFGEIIPKTIGRRHAEPIALRASLPLVVAMGVMAPVIAVTSGFARLVVRPFRAGARRHPFVTKEELRMVLQAEHRLALERDEASLIKRLLDFADARAREHMTPLVDTVQIPHTATVQQAVAVIHERGFSRLPVYTDRVDNITGIIEAMSLMDASPSQTSLSPYIRRPFYVPETAGIDRLLDELRRNQQEMAVVVDEHGSAVGVLTLEDIIEEIVGDVLDEFDRPGRSGIERLGEGTIVADGKVKLDQLEAALDDIDFPREGYETVAGLTAHLFQKVPQAGEAMVYRNIRITVMDASQRAVRKVRFQFLPDQAEAR